MAFPAPGPRGRNVRSRDGNMPRCKKPAAWIIDWHTVAVIAAVYGCMPASDAAAARPPPGVADETSEEDAVDGGLADWNLGFSRPGGIEQLSVFNFLPGFWTRPRYGRFGNPTTRRGISWQRNHAVLNGISRELISTRPKCSARKAFTRRGRCDAAAFGSRTPASISPNDSRRSQRTRWLSKSSLCPRRKGCDDSGGLQVRGPEGGFQYLPTSATDDQHERSRDPATLKYTTILWHTIPVDNGIFTVNGKYPSGRSEYTCLHEYRAGGESRTMSVRKSRSTMSMIYFGLKPKGTARDLERGGKRGCVPWQRGFGK